MINKHTLEEAFNSSLMQKRIDDERRTSFRHKLINLTYKESRSSVTFDFELWEYLQIDGINDPSPKYLEPFVRAAVHHGCFEKLEPSALEDLFRDESSSSGHTYYLWFVTCVAAEKGRKHLVVQLIRTLQALKRSDKPTYAPNSWLYIICRCLLNNNIDSNIPGISKEEEIGAAGFVIENESISDGGGHRWRLVHYAAAWGDIACMKVLMDKHLERNALLVPLAEITEEEGRNAPLHLAEITEEEGRNAVHLAAYHGHACFLSFMIQHQLQQSQGSAVAFSAKDKRARTPLHYASEQGYLAAVQVLFQDAGCEISVDAVDTFGLTALHLAASRGHTEVVEELLKNGAAQPCLQSTHDLTHLRFSATTLLYHIQLTFPYEWTKKAGRCYYFQLLLELLDKLSPNAVSSVLELEASVSSDAVLHLQPPLLQTELCSPEGFTALHFAVVYGRNPETIHKILEHAASTTSSTGGANAYHLIAIEDSAGLTPADWAAAIHFKEAQDIFKAERKKMEETGCHSCDSSRSLQELRIQSQYQRLKEAGREKERVQWTVDMGNALLYKHWNEAKNLASKGIDLKIKINAAIWQHLQWAIHITLVNSAHDHVRQHRKCLIEKMVVALVKGSAFSDSSSTLQACLMWAIKEVMVDLVEAIVKLTGDNKCDLLSVARGCHHTESPLEAATNMGEGGMELVAVMEGQEDVRRRLYEDRQVYVDYANTILVAAVLIAALAFQGWVQQPQGYKAMPLNDVGIGMRVFDWCNSWGFFFSMGAVMAGAAGAMPMKSGHIIKFVHRSKQTTTMASIMMAASVACQVVGFASALVSLESHADIIGMALCATVGITLVFVLLAVFLVRVNELQPLVRPLHKIKSWISDIYTHGEENLSNKFLPATASLARTCTRQLTRELLQFKVPFSIIKDCGNVAKCIIDCILGDLQTDGSWYDWYMGGSFSNDVGFSIIGGLWFGLVYAPFKLLLFNPMYVYVLKPIINFTVCQQFCVQPLARLRSLVSSSYYPAGACQRFCVKPIACLSSVVLVAPVLTIYVVLRVLISVCFRLLPTLIVFCYTSPRLLGAALSKLVSLLFSVWPRLFSDWRRLFSDWLRTLEKRATGTYKEEKPHTESGKEIEREV